MRSFIKAITASLLLFSISIFFSSCFSQSSLPDTWQPGMKLTMSYGGGMRYYSSTTVIQEEGSYEEINEEGKVTRTELHFTKAQLNELMKTLKANRFDKINSKMRDGIVYDMGTSSTQLTWDTHTYGYSVGATEEIPAKDQKQYETVSGYLSKFLHPKTN
jgi:hypothetical protein